MAHRAKLNIAATLSRIDGFWQPHIVAELNGADKNAFTVADPRWL